jgi:mannose-1-phosphate guanylyltransferase
VQIGYAFEGIKEQGEIVPKPFGSAGGMRRIQDFSGFFDDTTLVLCGDAIIDLDIGAALDEHRAKAALASVVTLDVPLAEVQNYGIVVADANGQIQSFQEKPKPEDAKSTAASTGIYIFEPDVLKLVPPGKIYDIGADLFPQLVEQKLPFFAQKRFFNWIDIGRVSDYWAVLQRVLRGEVAQMNMPGREIRPGIWVGLNTSIAWDEVNIEGPVYIGSSVRVEPGASIIGPSWIGNGCHIRSGAKVVRSILFEYTRIAADMQFKDMIVSPTYCVDQSGDTLYRGDETAQLRWGDSRA